MLKNIQKKGTEKRFLNYDDASEEIRRLAFNVAIMSYVEAYKDGNRKPSFIEKNLGEIKKISGLNSEEIQEVLNSRF